MLEPFKDVVLTITADNGMEFAHHRKITLALMVNFYFADPYCSHQRGLNENHNGLLRQYWPKKTDFNAITDQRVREVVEQLNDRPRAKLNYQTPSQVMQYCRDELDS